MFESSAQYSIVETEDGSKTVVSPLFDEAMHSTEGAVFESLNRHVMSALSHVGDVDGVFLDICFGLGYNSMALIRQMRNTPRTLHIFASEYDQGLSEIVQGMDAPDGFHDEFEIIKLVYRNGSYQDHKTRIDFFGGDARMLVKNLANTKTTVNAIFHDPHSPAKNCELWTKEIFILMRRIMAERSVLTTYSSALQVRRAMIEAGLFISTYKGNLKKEGTLAFKTQRDICIPEKEIQSIFDDPKSTPFRDDLALSLPRDRIRENRKMIIREIKENRRNNCTGKI